MLPEQVGTYKQVRHSLSPDTIDFAGVPTAMEEAEYVGSDGSRALVGIDHFQQDSKAYERFSLAADFARRQGQPNLEIRSDIGTACFVFGNTIGFFRGTSFVRMGRLKGSLESLHELAEALSNTLDKSEDDIPALIKHLPNPEEAEKNAVYLNNFADLIQLDIQRPVFSAIESGGNADAVLASYGPSKLLIIEFNTPQLAADNDQRIIARIQELWKLGLPAPTAYRRVGNYSVFVFDAPDEQTAKQLIDQVKYEQVVQWLGENPNIFKEAQKRYINTTLGVLVAVLKASGFALITCLGMGGLIGALLFNHRRAQQKDVAAYSDAGGMLRLNLDEMTPETNPARLLSERN
ncbi:MAG TPA: hypothetical protein VJ875_15805 [Pyrinomonadaceae bacterium]|nr:hypothetical protein [Pyrinomonadaceae bacterium]